MSKHICILQTSFAKREDTIAYLLENMPDLRIDFITDSSLLSDVKAAGHPTPDVEARMTLYALAAEKMGVDLIVSTCSTVGEVADRLAQIVRVPLIKIDEPMAKAAVKAGTKIALIATVATTLGPSRRQIEKFGCEQGKEMKVTEYLDKEAWEALTVGDKAKHNQILMKSIRELDKQGYDAIVMAQISMRALLPDLKDVKTPLLCSFYSGLDYVLQLLKEKK